MQQESAIPMPQTPPLPEALQAQIRQLATDYFEDKEANTTAEQQVHDDEALVEFECEPDIMIGKFEEFFTNADANHDGLLDEQESLIFGLAIRQYFLDKGQY